MPLGRLPWDYCLLVSKKMQGMTPMGLIAPMTDSIYIIALQPDLWEINKMALVPPGPNLLRLLPYSQ